MTTAIPHRASERMETINPRQARFVAAYVADPNATRAAIAAGYSELSAASRGHDLRRNSKAAGAIAAAQAALERVSKITTELVVGAAWSLYGEARKAGAYAAAAKCIDMLARHLGMYAPERHDVRVETITVEQAERVIESRIAELEAELGRGKPLGA